MGIQINGNTDSISAIDGNLSVQGNLGNLTGDLTGNVNSPGISTFSQLSVGADVVVSGITTTTQLNVGAGGTVITTTAGGNVGIGTDNLTRKLTISKDSETDLSGIELRVVGGISDGNNDGIFFTQSSDGSTSLGSIRCEYKTNGRPGLGFYTRDVGVVTESRKVYIDPDGRVTMPYQPAFHMENSANNSVWKGGTVHVNTGNHWDNTNGIFTAPIAGVYLFELHGQATGGGYWYAGITVNGVSKSTWYTDETSGYRHASCTLIISLSANDQVQGTKLSSSVTLNTGGQNGFCGFLIG